MRRPVPFLALPLAVACDNTVDFTVETGALLPAFEGRTLYVDLVVGGVLEERLEVEIAEPTATTWPDRLDVRNQYGMVGYVDADEDGICTLDPADPAWAFIYAPGLDIDYTWRPDPDVLEDPAFACGWFGSLEGGPVDPTVTPGG